MPDAPPAALSGPRRPGRARLLNKISTRTSRDQAEPAGTVPVGLLGRDLLDRDDGRPPRSSSSGGGSGSGLGYSRTGIGGRPNFNGFSITRCMMSMSRLAAVGRQGVSLRVRLAFGLEKYIKDIRRPIPGRLRTRW